MKMIEILMPAVYHGREVTDMAGLQPKKMLILNILEILKKYSDEDHPLKQKQIGEILLRDYGMSVDRKAIKRNLAELMDSGYPVRIKTEKARTTLNRETGEMEENTTCTDPYHGGQCRSLRCDRTVYPAARGTVQYPGNRLRQMECNHDGADPRG